MGFTKDEIRKALETAGIDPKRRAETLSLEDFAALADAFME
jgi:16S rRNA (adenine1518-N6/adenine1519-N6)-dimethyltransferase